MWVIIVLILSGPDVKKCDNLPVLEWRRCQPRVVNLGPWRPEYLIYTLADATVTTYAPAPYGEYSTEKHVEEKGP